MIKKWVCAFVLGLMLFLCWGHPAHATIVAPAPVAPAPVRPPIVNPNITGGTLAPSAPAPMMPRALPGSAPIPYYYPVGLPAPTPPKPRNPLCSIQGYVARETDIAVRGFWKMFYGTEYFASIFGGVAKDFNIYLYREFYKELPREFRPHSSYQDNVRYGDIIYPNVEMVLRPKVKTCNEYDPNNCTWLLESNDITMGYARHRISWPRDFELVPIKILPECDEEEEPEEPETCSQDDLLKCLFKVFAQKFPFDVLNAIPDDRGFTCPTYTFFYKEFNICWLYGMVAVFKYPIILGLLIKVIIHL